MASVNLTNADHPRAAIYCRSINSSEGFTLLEGRADGAALVSDAVGNGTWQPLADVIPPPGSATTLHVLDTIEGAVSPTAYLYTLSRTAVAPGGGTQVTLHLNAFVTTATATSPFILTAPLPTSYRPLAAVSRWALPTVCDIAHVGMVEITSAGVVTIYAHCSAEPFGEGLNSAFLDFFATWDLTAQQ